MLTRKKYVIPKPVPTPTAIFPEGIVRSATDTDGWRLNVYRSDKYTSSSRNRRHIAILRNGKEERILKPDTAVLTLSLKPPLGLQNWTACEKFKEKSKEKSKKNEDDANRRLKSCRWSATDLTQNSKSQRRVKIQAFEDRSKVSNSKSQTGTSNVRLKEDKLNIFPVYDLQGRRMLTRAVTELTLSSNPRADYESVLSQKRRKNLLKEWTHTAYKHRMKQMLVTDRVNLEQFLTNSVSSRSMSGTSTVETAPLVSQSRRSSYNKQGRRSSVFWVPPTHDNEREKKRQIRNFRWVGKIIQSMVRLLRDMQQLSISKTQQSAYSEMLYIVAGARTHAGQEGHGEEGQLLLFDKSWYSRNRAWSRMPSWAQSVMQLPPQLRTGEDINHLKQLLSTMRSFRENLTDDMRTKMCQVVRYTKCDKGRVVFRQDQVGFDFYYIFSGSVFVQVDLYDEKNDETSPFVENVLKAGEGFGEIALLGDGVRTASVICKEPTELCQIDKTTFLEICPALFNQQLQKKINFARQFPIFQFCEAETLKNLCFLSQVIDVPHSTVIEPNWATSNYAYFVMKGRISLLKEFDVSDFVGKSAQINDVAGIYDVSESKNKCYHKVKAENTRFAHVGMLCEGDHTDLSVLSVEPRKDIPHITLVSEGARLFRVAIRTFIRLTSRRSPEEYLRKVYKPMTFPSEEELLDHFLKTQNWTEFKKNVIHTQLLQKAGHVMANVPATLKGSSGWAKWPGFSMTSKNKRSQVFKVEPLPKNEDSIDDDVSDDDRTDDSSGSTIDNEIQNLCDDQRVIGRYESSPSNLDLRIFHREVSSDHSSILAPPKTTKLSNWKKQLTNEYFLVDETIELEELGEGAVLRRKSDSDEGYY